MRWVVALRSFGIRGLVGSSLAFLPGCDGSDVTRPSGHIDSIPDAGVFRQSEVDAAPACGGARYGGICWYLAADGQSCEDACAERGGFNAASVSHIGSVEEGGSLERCASVLTALRGNPDVVVKPTVETEGIGCHLYGAAEDRWWLTEPNFDPQATWEKVQIVCGCNE
jgi:hypothetical protein